MVRTRNLVVCVLLLTLLLIAYALFHRTPRALVSMSLIEPLFGETETEYSVAEGRGLDRASLRASLREALRGKTYTEGANPPEEAPVLDQKSETEAFLCAEASPYTETAVWGSEVVMTVLEGARVFTGADPIVGFLATRTLQFASQATKAPAPSCPLDTRVGITPSGMYIMAGLSPQALTAAEPSGLAGYALDGFGIFKNHRDGDGGLGAPLDPCGGHTHTILWDGVPENLYHYHGSPRCLMGRPVVLQ